MTTVASVLYVLREARSLVTAMKYAVAMGVAQQRGHRSGHPQPLPLCGGTRRLPVGGLAELHPAGLPARPLGTFEPSSRPRPWCGVQRTGAAAQGGVVLHQQALQLSAAGPDHHMLGGHLSGSPRSTWRSPAW
jgi:hypothetical protein